ncbi:hypothetical protein F511_42690 [Dorcoceras hygrometricum]|uniref:DUF4219 domain-containing protein n=1 Tax=Dorcoceras hygrometricum TaxID=472368 RepID=A0A2Z7DJ43_9LAMI|nr:hypothetical protein F511_42690 [Dorcoceras hygrometricum]
MSTSHNKIPMFSKEDYDNWKIRMQAHLAAQDDDMWYVITEGPLKIMKPNLAFAISNGEPQFLEKCRHEYTNEDMLSGIVVMFVAAGCMCLFCFLLLCFLFLGLGTFCSVASAKDFVISGGTC